MMYAKRSEHSAHDAQMPAAQAAAERGGSRIAYVDVAKALAVFCVALGHAVPGTSPVFAFLFAFHMPVFFFLAGYCTKRSSRTFTAYTMDKARKLLIPYVIFSLLGLLIMAIFPEWRTYTDVKDYLRRYIYIAQPYALGSVWFLPCLFFTSIIAYCVLRIWSGKNPWALVPCIVFLGLFGTKLYDLAYSRFYDRFPMKIDTAITAASFLLMGYLFREKGRFESWRTWQLAIGAVILPVLVWLFGVRLNGYVNLCDCYYGKIYYFFPGAICGCLWLLILGRLLEKIRPLQWFGKNSLPIFAVHSFFLWTLVEAYGAIIGQKLYYAPELISALIISALTCVACVPFALLYNAIAKRLRKDSQR